MNWIMDFLENLDDVGEKIGSSILLPLTIIIDLIVTIINMAQHWKETNNVTAYFLNQYLSSFGIVFFWTVIGMIVITIVVSLAAITAEAIDSWQQKRLNECKSHAEAEAKEQATPEVPKP
jgi:hypothetical protein